MNRLFIKILNSSTIKNVLGVSVFNIIGAFIGFVLNIFLARYFSVEEYGDISFFIATFLILFTIFEFGFSNTLVILSSKVDSNAREKVFAYINNKFILFTSSLLVLLIVLLNLFHDFFGAYYSVFQIATFAAYLFGIYRYLISIFQAEAKWRLYNIYNVLNNFIKVVVIAGIITVFEVVLKKNVSIEIYYYSFLLYVVLLFLLTLIFKKNKVSFLKSSSTISSNYFYQTLLPLGTINLLIIAAMRADIYIIDSQLGSFEVGVYSVANSLALIFPLITSSVMKVLVRESSKKGIGFLVKIIEIQKKFYLHLIIVIFLVILSAKYLIILLFGVKYIDSILIFQVLITVYIGGMFFTPLESFFISNKPNQILIVRIVQLVIIVLLGLILISLFGIIGMSLTVVISRLVGWLYFTIKSNFIINEYNSKI